VALPATLVLVAFPLAVSTVAREHHAVEWRSLRWMLLGAVPGTLIGLAIVGQVDASQLAVVVGTVTLAGVALSVLSPPIPVTPGSSLAAGFFSNVFGTASSVGGPPVALLFQHRQGPVARSTLGGFFATSAVMSLVGYAATGTITGDQALFAVTLAPFMVGGLWASRHLAPVRRLGLASPHGAHAVRDRRHRGDPPGRAVSPRDATGGEGRNPRSRFAPGLGSGQNC